MDNVNPAQPPSIGDAQPVKVALPSENFARMIREWGIANKATERLKEARRKKWEAVGVFEQGRWTPKTDEQRDRCLATIHFHKGQELAFRFILETVGAPIPDEVPF